MSNTTYAYPMTTVTSPCVVTGHGENHTQHYNATVTPCTEDDDVKELLKRILSIVIAVIVAIIMIGMGCSVELKKLAEVFKKPTGIITGILCQFIIMPILAYMWASIFEMEDPETLSLLIIGSCPGGTFSNIVAFWVGGDMELSIAMTTTSVIAALGMLPLLIYIYSLLIPKSSIHVPFETVGIAIALILVPLSIGVFIRYKFPKAAAKILKITSLIGIGAMIAAVGVTIFTFYEFFSLQFGQIVTAIIYPFCGMIIGYVVPTLTSFYKPLHLSPCQRRTVSIEVGIQNAQVAASIVQLSNWSIEITGRVLMLPLLYGLAQVFWAFAYIVLYQCLYYKRNGKLLLKKSIKKDEEQPEDVQKGDPVGAVDNLALETKE